MRCLTGRGQCPVGHGVRRKCQKCRLERCLIVGMRKDFLQTDEEKQRRQQRLEENRNLTSKRISISDSSNPQSSPTTLDEIDQVETLILNFFVFHEISYLVIIGYAK